MQTEDGGLEYNMSKTRQKEREGTVSCSNVAKLLQFLELVCALGMNGEKTVMLANRVSAEEK